VSVPEHLHINGREPDQYFESDDLLFRSFTLCEYDATINSIKTETIRFPDISCNWCRYSEPGDVQHRNNGNPSDGCYSFSVKVSSYQNQAKPVHDPIDDQDYPNYSHTEIRALRQTDQLNAIPPQRRKFAPPSKRLAYRDNIANNLKIEIMATT
jgi:hypothetical protein